MVMTVVLVMAAVVVAAALLALVFSVGLASRFGLIDLIAGGYGTLTWVFIAVFLLPLMTVGLRRIIQK